eukprot:TRINITY_DN2371_c0_g2_i2.p1 TRINITY_DN2371_c0_g2~~TRINITY_DN2371_c0_g2_i2.p1  ORF type:complete len:143 (-),score=12.93 TRINITY_DN2371_c0_g2_i2:354-782(-)
MDLDKALQFQLKQADKHKQVELNSLQPNFSDQYEEINEDMKEWIDQYQKTHVVSKESDHIQHDLQDRAKTLISETEKAGLSKQLHQKKQKQNPNGSVGQNGLPKNGSDSQIANPKNGVTQGPVFLKDGSILFTNDALKASQN